MRTGAVRFEPRQCSTKGGSPARGQFKVENVYLARSAIAGTGVFASRQFRAGELIMSFKEGAPTAVPYGVTLNHPEHEE